MSATSFSIANFKEVAVRLPPTRSILIRANHGVGKSKVVRQISAIIRKQLFEQKVIKLADAYPVIDRRLGQMSEGDLIGLPSTDGNTTRFNPPDWYHMSCDQPCALFLDELNRATPEVMQGSFQIALDRELNGHRLHKFSRVYSAVNIGASYTVNEIDPALLSRFFVVDLDPDPKEFVAWARNSDPEQGGNLHYFVPDFIEGNEKWLYPAKNADPGSQQPTPRSWEFVNEALVYAGVIDNPTSQLFYQIARGFVGNEAAIAFRDFCKNADNQVTGEEIINQLQTPRVLAKVKRQGQDRMNGLVEKASDYVNKNCERINQAQGTNIKEFMKILDDELRISFWSKLTSHGIEKMELCKSIHKYCAKDVLDVFGVPMGEAGIGIIPNIPGIFKAPAKGKK
jgi:hypothetical protein